MPAAAVDVAGTPVAPVIEDGEEVLWAGRPSGRLYIGDDVTWIWFGLLLLSGGWGILGDFAGWSGPRGFGWSMRAVGCAGVFLGAYIGFGRALVDRYRRRGTWYALTTRRAIIVEGTRVAWWGPAGLMNVRLGNWDASLEIRGISDASLIPQRLRGFRAIADARKVVSLIGVHVAQRLIDVAAPPRTAPPDGPPVVRGVQEAQRDGRTLEYYDPIGDALFPGERKVWAARPTRRFLLRGNDAIVIPAAAVAIIACAWWLLVALGWFGRGIQPGAAFASVIGGMICFGQLMKRLVVPWQLRGRQWYAITDRRCLWVSDGRPHELRVVVPAHAMGVMVERHDDGTGTIAVALRYALEARFEHIDDVDAAHAEIRALLRAPPPRRRPSVYRTGDAERSPDADGSGSGNGGGGGGRGGEI